eukprot:477448-Pleurochrysis_carterae.AAC.1
MSGSRRVPRLHVQGKAGKGHWQKNEECGFCSEGESKSRVRCVGGGEEDSVSLWGKLRVRSGQVSLT